MKFSTTTTLRGKKPSLMAAAALLLVLSVAALLNDGAAVSVDGELKESWGNDADGGVSGGGRRDALCAIEYRQQPGDDAAEACGAVAAGVRVVRGCGRRGAVGDGLQWRQAVVVDVRDGGLCRRRGVGADEDRRRLVVVGDKLQWRQAVVVAVRDSGLRRRRGVGRLVWHPVELVAPGDAVDLIDAEGFTAVGVGPVFGFVLTLIQMAIQ